MKTCLLCAKKFRSEFQVQDIFSFRSLTTNTWICLRCLNSFNKLTKQSTCSDCGRLLAPKEINPCQDCQIWKVQENRFINRALYEYNQAFKDYMAKYKFMGDYRLRLVFQTEFSRAIKAEKKITVAIPVTPTTLETRGFNQVTGWLANVEHYDVLTPLAHSKQVAQSQKNRRDRLNLKQPFQIIDAAIPVIQGKDVLIIDDVYTTGRTIRHAANIIKDAGARSVTGLTMAR